MCPKVPGMRTGYQKLCRGLGDRRDGIEAGGKHQPRLACPVILALDPILRGQQPLLLCQDQQVPLLEGQEGDIICNYKSHTQAEDPPFTKGSEEARGYWHSMGCLF